MENLTFEEYQEGVQKLQLEIKEIENGRLQINDPLDNELSNSPFPYIYDMYIVMNIRDILNEGPETKEDAIDKKLNELFIKYEYIINSKYQPKTGLAGKLNGFEFRVYSNDHDMHFHIIHRGKGVNARYSFPEIELMNYKNYKNIITSSQQAKIKEFFSDENNFNRLKKEFDMRSATQ